jgi:hypothetical protein
MMNVIVGFAWADKEGFSTGPNNNKQVKTIIAEIAYPGVTVDELERIGDKEHVLIEKRFWQDAVSLRGAERRSNLFLRLFRSLCSLAMTGNAFADGQTTASVMVYIPKFTTANMPQAGLDGLEMGGFWMDKYEASQPDASASSVGSTSTNNPGTTAAVSQQGVVAWHTINWNNAKTACENRGQKKTAAPSATGTTTTLIDNTNFPAYVVGKHIRITQGGVVYHRRITAYNKDATNKYVTFTPALLAATTTSDSYTICEYHLVTPYEWASIAYWCAMHTQPKGNNRYGADTADTDNNVYASASASKKPNYGITDPQSGTYTDGRWDRVLTGTGLRTWSHNQQSTGVWDLNGNVWEWVDLKIGTQTNYLISNGFPGEGYTVPSSNNYINQLEASDATVKTMAIPSTVGSANASYGNDYYWVNTGERAAVRGGLWGDGTGAGVFSLVLINAPSSTYTFIGFRAAR